MLVVRYIQSQIPRELVELLIDYYTMQVNVVLKILKYIIYCVLNQACTFWSAVGVHMVYSVKSALPTKLVNINYMYSSVEMLATAY